jgi:hypothetical protein
MPESERTLVAINAVLADRVGDFVEWIRSEPLGLDHG